MMQRTVAIALKIPDNTAYTALAALRRLGVAVAGVQRSDVWSVHDGGDAATFLERVRADQTLFNPNKHQLIDLPESKPRLGEVWVSRIAGADDARDTARTGIAGAVSARRYIAWRLLGTDGEPAADATVRAAAEGLLCNPAIEIATYS